MAEGGRGGRERGREELRSWMAAKRKERLVQFLAERDRLRKREKHPFQPPASVRTLISTTHTVQCVQHVAK